MGSLLKLETHIFSNDGQVEDTVQQRRRFPAIPIARLMDAKKHAGGDGLSDIKPSVTSPAPSTQSTRLLVAGEIALPADTAKTPDFLVSTHGPESANVPPNEGIGKVKLWEQRKRNDSTSPAVRQALLDQDSRAPTAAHPGDAVLPALMSKMTDVSSLLNTLLPPQRTICPNTGRVVVQTASLEQSSRVEVSELHERVLRQLQERRARESGICPVRREIYSELFDELIREITLEEPARGILLVRVRDEMNQTLDAHRALAEEALLFASKQRMDAPKSIDEIQRRIKELEEERDDLLMKRRAASVREERMQKEILDENTARVKVWQDETCYYRRINRQVSQRIKAETERANAHGLQVDCVVLDGEQGPSELSLDV
uniref:Putative 33 kDa inner dynein arm light chain, axonemal n=1 Tax=Trypanosoma congolense (strain IL3000) TaxID=1068625 RepID=G0UXV3_TRYCI|nr:putative 33 kDa inner dynein arm light chain, axonemal [Trypanosoma congolense IL3000]